MYSFAKQMVKNETLHMETTNILRIGAKSNHILVSTPGILCI